MDRLRLGILGMSEGNGHPYSWAAIFNGYDVFEMSKCPFPVIPEYLSKQKFPEDSINTARVTHIWTQDLEVSNEIAKASKIDHVVSKPEDMIGQVDAVLLARDDPDNHFEMSLPFLDAGLPIFIDKPLDTSIMGAKRIFENQQFDWQVFSCSSIRYAQEFSPGEISSIEDIGLIEASIPKSWEKYGVHIIEPVLNLRSDWGEIVKITNSGSDDVNIVTVLWQNGIHTVFKVLGNLNCPLRISIYGKNEHKELVFRDTFDAFKNSLKAFIHGIENKTTIIPREETLRVVEVIDKGMKK